MKLIPLLPAQWISGLGTALVMGTLLSTATGCGTLGAMANPKIAWAVQDPAPLTVVVRRADAAAATSKEIDRLLTSTPANADSDWVGKVAPSADDTKGSLKVLGDMPIYKTSKARVVSSEVWVRTLPGVKSDNGQFPNLLAEVDPALGDSYAKIMSKRKDIADLKTQIGTESDAASAKGVSDADKKSHQETIDGLKKQLSKAEDEVEPLQKQFLKDAVVSAGKASGDVKGKVGVAFFSLRQAADDADIANGAAAVRYPLALPGIKDALLDQVNIIIGDIVEEKTGHRPILSGFKPGVSLEGGNVTLTLNGIPVNDLGSLSVVDLTAEALKRTQTWVGHALTLMLDVGTTKEMLSFEENVLDALLQGFKSSGWNPPGPVTVDTSAAALAAAASFVPKASAATTTSGTVAAAVDTSSAAPTAKSAKRKSAKPKGKPATPPSN
jgi:hypothetical protein